MTTVPPLGDAGGDVRPAEALIGARVTLRRPAPADDVQALYSATHGSRRAEAVWDHMGYGPFADLATMRSWMEECTASSDPWWYTVTLEGEPVGMAALLNHHPVDRRIEAGHIWYVPEAQRGTVNSEALLLMGSHAFTTLACRRFEWKCDDRNEPSKAAALRLGYTFEGVFRQHMVVKGRNRDTAWFSIIDSEWPTVEAALRHWLYDEPRDKRGRPERSLAEVRASL